MSRICEVTGKAGLVGNMVLSRLLLRNSASNLDFLRFAKIHRLTG